MRARFVAGAGLYFTMLRGTPAPQLRFQRAEKSSNLSISTVHRKYRSQTSTGLHAGLQELDLFGREWRLEKMLPLLINPEEVRDEVHAIREVSPILRAAVV